MFVVAKDRVDASRIQMGELSRLQRDRVKSIDQFTLVLAAPTAKAQQAFLQCLNHCIRFGFAGECSQLCGQAISFWIGDVERHGQIV